MTRQIIFAIVLLITLSAFAWTAKRIISYFKLTRPAFPVRNPGRRLMVMLEVAFGQTRIFRKPVSGFLHALVFWGFCVILIGSVEMVIDGLAGTERALKALGKVYDVISASGDIFALVIVVAIAIFLFRRLFVHTKRFEGIEMKRISHIDAAIALTMILFLMISLLGMNVSYSAMQLNHGHELAGLYPASDMFLGYFTSMSDDNLFIWHEIFWWAHIGLIFIFANMLPYSKHFHVFMSVPNVYLSNLEPLGKLANMENITREVKLMMNPDTAFTASSDESPPERFGVKDAEDVTWKNYFDSLACTECGRCTAVCPANITGKRLSPRKIMMDLRARMKQKGPGLVKNGRGYDDGLSLLRSFISEEELWACTTCNACARECPININHPSLIVDMRRYLVMEEGSAPGELKAVFSNIENNGAPWQYSPEDRLIWAKDLERNVH
jgi:heterodisulfide reductase subunit C/nitrate reductase gamma subunit